LCGEPGEYCYRKEYQQSNACYHSGTGRLKQPGDGDSGENEESAAADDSQPLQLRANCHPELSPGMTSALFDTTLPPCIAIASRSRNIFMFMIPQARIDFTQPLIYASKA